MTVKAIMPERKFDLVVPLAHEATDMRTTESAGSSLACSGAVSPLSGNTARQCDVDSTIGAHPIPAMPTFRTSTMAIRTTTTRTINTGRAPSADEELFGHADFSFEALVGAYWDCRKNKRNTYSALTFEENLERNLCALHRELLNFSYRPGRSVCFVVTRPKLREVWAADFRDRIVHHLLYNLIAPRFHARFIADSCACIPGRGTLYAAARLDSKIRSITQNWSRLAWYLKLDIANFFVSIDKRVVQRLLEEMVPEPSWQWLAKTILFHDPRESYELRGDPRLLDRIPPHKSLLNQPPHLGLPIGNLSSQFFANIILNPLDQFVKHDLHIRHYIRYVDDFLLLDESPDRLARALSAIAEFLPATLHLRLNNRKTILQPIDRGVDFVGTLVKPWCRITRKRTFRDAMARISSMDETDVFESANSYFGLLRQAPQSHHHRTRLANVLRQRGHGVNQQITKVYRKSNL